VTPGATTGATTGVTPGATLESRPEARPEETAKETAGETAGETSGETAGESTAAAAAAAAAASAAAEAVSVAAAEAVSVAAKVNLEAKPFEEVDIKRLWGEWQKGYIIKRYKFDNLPPMILVHYMGELLYEDEFIPASKESEKIRPRTATSIVGGVGISDQTPELLKSLYGESMMRTYDIEAKAAATKAADTSAPPENHIAPQEIPTMPVRTSDAIKAINKLYEKYDKKAEKVQKIIDIKKSFNAGLKSLAKLLLEMYTKSLESHATWKTTGARKTTPRNLYINSDQFDAIKKQFEEALKSFKKSDDFKYIDGDADDCDKIISDFKPSTFRPVFSENKELLIKICMLFSMYKRWMGQIDFYNNYFKKWNDMNGGLDMKFNRQTEENILNNFNSNSRYLTNILQDLDNDVKDTKVLEENLRVAPVVNGTGLNTEQAEAMRRGGGGGNKHKNRTRHRTKPTK
jgi:hypothetical protein